MVKIGKFFVFIIYVFVWLVTLLFSVLAPLVFCFSFASDGKWFLATGALLWSFLGIAALYWLIKGDENPEAGKEPEPFWFS